MSYQFKELVVDLYRAFDTPATMLDPYDRVLAYSDQPMHLADDVRRRNLLVDSVEDDYTRAVVRHVNDVARTVTEVTRIPAAPELGLLERVVIPLTTGGVTTAYIYLVDPKRRVRVEDLQPYQSTFDSVAKQVELERLARFRVHAAVAGIVSGDEVERRIAVETLDDMGMGPVPPMRVAVLTGSDSTSDTLWTRMLGRDSAWAEISGRIVATVGRCSDRNVDLLRSRVEAGTGFDSSARLCMGLGEPVTELDKIHVSYRQAVRALRLAESGATDRRTAVWNELGPWRTLLTLSQAEATASLDPRVQQLVTHEEHETLRMVRRYLEREVGADAIADEFHLHRTTLYERLRRTQERYALHWDSADDRLATVIGIRLTLLHWARGVIRPS